MQAVGYNMIVFFQQLFSEDSGRYKVSQHLGG